mmetsp:Transcript_46803/g.141771  ORF Transcript_46803/g.141771 Transcript_46803/m.141771 type:complete len:440 (-) Transcript_46803:1692-3011(-)
MHRLGSLPSRVSPRLAVLLHVGHCVVDVALTSPAEHRRQGVPARPPHHIPEELLGEAGVDVRHPALLDQPGERLDVVPFGIGPPHPDAVVFRQRPACRGGPRRIEHARLELKVQPVEPFLGGIPLEPRPGAVQVGGVGHVHLESVPLLLVLGQPAPRDEEELGYGDGLGLSGASSSSGELVARGHRIIKPANRRHDRRRGGTGRDGGDEESTGRGLAERAREGSPGLVAVDGVVVRSHPLEGGEVEAVPLSHPPAHRGFKGHAQLIADAVGPGLLVEGDHVARSGGGRHDGGNGEALNFPYAHGRGNVRKCAGARDHVEAAPVAVRVRRLRLRVQQIHRRLLPRAHPGRGRRTRNEPRRGGEDCLQFPPQVLHRERVEGHDDGGPFHELGVLREHPRQGGAGLGVPRLDLDDHSCLAADGVSAPEHVEEEGRPHTGLEG